jgi:hypothetical protein
MIGHGLAAHITGAHVKSELHWLLPNSLDIKG